MPYRLVALDHRLVVGILWLLTIGLAILLWVSLMGLGDALKARRRALLAEKVRTNFGWQKKEKGGI